MFAGFLVAGLWVALAIVMLRRVEAGPPEPAPPPGFGWLVGLGAVGALGAAAAAGAGAERITLYPAERTTTVVGSLALAALAVVIVAGTVILASTPGDGPAGPSDPEPGPASTAGRHDPVAERLADRAASGADLVLGRVVDREVDTGAVDHDAESRARALVSCFLAVNSSRATRALEIDDQDHAVHRGGDRRRVGDCGHGNGVDEDDVGVQPELREELL